VQGEPGGARTHVERIRVRPKALSAFTSWTSTRTRPWSRCTDQHVANASSFPISLPSICLPLKAKAVLRAYLAYGITENLATDVSRICSRDTTLRASQTASGASRTGDLIGRHRLTMATRWRSSPSASLGNVCCNHVTAANSVATMKAVTTYVRLSTSSDARRLCDGSGQRSRNSPLARATVWLGTHIQPWSPRPPWPAPRRRRSREHGNPAGS
jgi:hypothetical protein